MTRGTSVFRFRAPPAYLDDQDLGRVHLLVQELHDPAELGRDGVGYEAQADLAGLEIGLHPLPEVTRRDVAAEELGKRSLWIETFSAGAFLEASPDRLLGPVEDGVGGVVEELAHDLPPYPGIAATLDLDESGDAVLV